MQVRPQRQIIFALHGTVLLSCIVGGALGLRFMIGRVLGLSFVDTPRFLLCNSCSMGRQPFGELTYTVDHITQMMFKTSFILVSVRTNSPKTVNAYVLITGNTDHMVHIK